MRQPLSALLLLFMIAAFSPALRAEDRAVRLGHFPNITHAQALLARATGSYEKILGKRIEWLQFNAGPSAVEALFNGEVDATYIGPTPAINGYVKSHGAAFVIVAGSAQGGAGLVVRPDAGISATKDLAGKKISTPQLGNTQDIAARQFLRNAGIALEEKGGTTSLIPLANADSLTMFQRKEIDGVWSVEPWLSRLEIEGGGKLLIDERDLWPGGRYPTTVLVVSKRFLTENPADVQKLVAAHAEATRMLNAEPAKFLPILNEELKRETGKALPPEVLERAIGRVTFDTMPLQESLEAGLNAAKLLGFVKKEGSIEGIWQLEQLHQVSATLTPESTSPPKE